MTDSPPTQTTIVKQAPNAVTWTRTGTVGLGVPAVATLTAFALTYLFQVLTYYSPGFPVPPFVNDPVQLSVVSSAVAGLFGALAAWVQRGTTTVTKGDEK